MQKGKNPAFLYLITCLGLTCLAQLSQAQSPVITVRFANAQSDCGNQEYCLDVEFQSDMPDQELFGMNIRFFYNDETLELIDFRDFQGGYDAVAPDPPIISTSELAGPALFNFTGPADFVNGAMQLVNTGAPPIILNTSTWTKLFQICFTVDDQSAANLDTFCPPIVWDLEQDPANGGFLSGDDGVVMTIVDANGQSEPADENVVQFNWEYIGNGDPPYGQPVEIACSNINCLLPVAWASFQVDQVGTGHLLSWEAVHTEQTKSFDIEWSPDGQNWSYLTSQEATYGETGFSKYSWVHHFPFPGWNYYRIKQIEIGDTYSYSPVKRQWMEDGQEVLMVYPNPSTHGTLYIRHTKGSLQGATFRMADLTGRIIQVYPLLSSFQELDVSDIPRGLYTLQLIDGNGIQAYRKICIH